MTCVSVKFVVRFSNDMYNKRPVQRVQRIFMNPQPKISGRNILLNLTSMFGEERVIIFKESEMSVFEPVIFRFLYRDAFSQSRLNNALSLSQKIVDQRYSSSKNC